MKRWHPIAILFVITALFAGLFAGCSTLDEKQRGWIFQPSDASWGGGLAAAEGMDDVWISFKPAASADSDKPVELHGLWLAADQSTTAPVGLQLGQTRDAGTGTGQSQGTQGTTRLALARPQSLATPRTLALPDPGTAPILLYLHGARYNVTGSAPRMRRMQELGFSVLAIDYRGFGKSTHTLPSEKSSYEDARAAWDWLAKKYPDRPRYIFGHSLGGSIAINLAAEVADEKGTIVEGTFTSIADVIGSTEWGWVPLSMLLTQRFDAVSKAAHIGSPLLVVHGDSDRLISPVLGRKLFAAAAEPKQFLLVKGGSHHNTNLIGQAQYRSALAEMMQVKPLEAMTAASGVGASDGSIKAGTADARLIKQ